MFLSRPGFLPLSLLGGLVLVSFVAQTPSGLSDSRLLRVAGVGNATAEPLPLASGDYRRFDHGGAGGVQMILPDEHSIHAESSVDSITITKSSDYYQYEFPTLRNGWKYLDLATRQRIDRALHKSPGWDRIVIHATGSETGNLRILDATHRKQFQRDTVAYHFVIGNGTHSGSGEIEVSSRWETQEDDGAINTNHSDLRSLSICLVGDFNETTAHDSQLESLHELIGYLRAKLGVIEVMPHRQLESDARSCPGRYFPSSLFEKINARS